MCEFNTLFHQNNTGYIIQCKDCKRLLLGYGNVNIVLYPDEYLKFFRLIAHLHEQAHPEDLQHIKSIQIPTPAESLTLLFSPNELRELYQMLEEADTELRTTSLIELFN